MRNLPQLMSACYEAVNNEDFLPEKDDNGNIIKTCCNEFVQFVAGSMLCTDFNGLLANDIIDTMNDSMNWMSLAMMDAQTRANAGTLVIAGLKAEPHGHVCVLVPGMPVRSSHWAMMNAICANVGETVFIGKGLSFAFREIPHLWAWKPSLL